MTADNRGWDTADHLAPCRRNGRGAHATGSVALSVTAIRAGISHLRHRVTALLAFGTNTPVARGIRLTCLQTVTNSSPRDAYWRGDWRAAHRHFGRAHTTAELNTDDLSAYGMAAWRLGYGRESIQLSEQAFNRLIAAMTRTR